MEQQQQAKFEGWAVLELMGHQREIGFVTTEYFGPAAMFRVDRPEIPEREYELERPEYLDMKWCGAGTKVRRPALEAKSRLVAPGSIYAINPCTEEAARKLIERELGRSLVLIEFKQDKGLQLKGIDEAEPEKDEAPEGWNGDGR